MLQNEITIVFYVPGNSIFAQNTRNAREISFCLYSAFDTNIYMGLFCLKKLFKTTNMKTTVIYIQIHLLNIWLKNVYIFAPKLNFI